MIKHYIFLADGSEIIVCGRDNKQCMEHARIVWDQFAALYGEDFMANARP